MKARLLGFEDLRGQLEKSLTYVDQKVDFELKRTSGSIRRWEKVKVRSALIDRMGEPLYDERLAEMKARATALKAERKKSILFEDPQGIWTYSGLAPRIARAAKRCEITSTYQQPLLGGIVWDKTPKYQDRPYQTEAQQLLLEAAPFGPCGIELPTGSGKSTVIRNLLMRAGAGGAVIMAPSSSIALQLHRDLVLHFGAQRVGFYGGGKKEFNRLVVVGIDDSLTRVTEGSPAWNALSRKAIFVADEAHLTPANSLQKVCFGLMARAPYRFFVSATLTRNDGRDLVLEGIVGKVVLEKSVRELVDQGYLSRPLFRMVEIPSYSNYRSPDANMMTRKHLYYNRLIHQQAADMANRFVGEMKRPTLILVKEIEQFTKLLPHLRHKVAFAHGPLDKEGKQLVPQEYHGGDTADLVEQFNRGEVPILVGTNCISTGTDVQVNEATIYLQGDKSEIAVRQGAVGRSTRGGRESNVINPWTGVQKTQCLVVDFDVVTEKVRDPVTQEVYWDQDFVVHKHADARRAIYESVYGPVRTVERLNAT